MSHDHVDAILEELRFRSSIFASMQLSGDWGFAKPKLEGSPFYIVTSGECVIRLAAGGSVRARQGDFVILPVGDAHDLMSDASSPLVPFKPLLRDMGWCAWTPGMRYKTGVLRYKAEGDASTSLIAGVFDFEDFRKNPLLIQLPCILHLPASRPHGGSAGLTAIVQLLAEAVETRGLGSGAIATRLADAVFIHAVRLHFTSVQDMDAGWLRGMEDPHIGEALALMHSSPGHPWTVGGLAAAVGMSRARFAARFRQLVGQAPLEYLTSWRMHRASRELVMDGRTLAEIGFGCGYKSEIAFSKAFRRWSGLLPREYRRKSPSWPPEDTSESAPGIQV
jgi:AraC-like DNA-binding protein